MTSVSPWPTDAPLTCTYAAAAAATASTASAATASAASAATGPGRRGAVLVDVRVALAPGLQAWVAACQVTLPFGAHYGKIVRVRPEGSCDGSTAGTYTRSLFSSS